MLAHGLKTGTTATITGSPAGSYAVTVTDGGGKTANANAVITQPSLLNLSRGVAKARRQAQPQPGMKKPQNLAVLGLSNLVRLAGIEPTTPWFVAKYSIQLSYSRALKGAYCTTNPVKIGWVC